MTLANFIIGYLGLGGIVVASFQFGGEHRIERSFLQRGVSTTYLLIGDLLWMWLTWPALLFLTRKPKEISQKTWQHIAERASAEVESQVPNPHAVQSFSRPGGP